MYRLILCCIASLCCAWLGAAQASEIFSDDVMAISYDDGSGVNTTDGTGKAEHYDVAMALDASGLIGKSIAGVRIPFVSTEDLSNLKVWIASDLKLDETDNLPVCDILEVSSEIRQDWTEISFESPLEINLPTLYIGYSFDVDKINSNNLKPVCLTSVSSSDGYYIHASRTSKYKKWTNVNENSQVGSLRMQVMVKGMDANAAAIELYPKINVEFGQIAYAPVRITCHGYKGVSSIEYEFDINGSKGVQTFTFDNPIEAVYDKFADVEIPLAKITEVGSLPLSINLTKVNGEVNSDEKKLAEGSLNVFDFVPVHRPILEEYTGAWCGNCPRGLAAIEAMKELYPDDFICISYHNNDAMALRLVFPSEIRGFPDCWISRKKNTDPFFGDKSDGQFHLDEEWDIIKKEPTTISVDVDAEWADLDESVIDVRVKLMSQIAYSTEDLAIACALIADDLHGDSSSWWQENYYSGNTDCAPELKWIADLPKQIKDFRFNDVLILSENLDGSETNLPTDIEPMKEYEVSFSLPLANAVNSAKESLVQDKSKLRVVAMGIDRNSTEILNSNQTDWMKSSGIGEKCLDSDEYTTEYYDLYGHKTSPHAKGIVLKVLYRSNGSKECVKLINK